jgi:hypothetical protein
MSVAKPLKSEYAPLVSIEFALKRWQGKSGKTKDKGE